MRTLDTNSEDLHAFMVQPEAGPVVMINLLRFQERTDSGEAGVEVYARYASNAVLLVEYPSRAAFAQMVSDPRFQEVQKDRLDALEETVLIACTPQR